MTKSRKHHNYSHAPHYFAPGQVENYRITQSRSIDMYRNTNKNPSPVCNFIPSYSSYEGIGGSFASGLSNFVEAVLRLLNGFRW